MLDGIIERVFFDEYHHTYNYDGKYLNGVTGVISEKLGKHFPRENARVEAVCSYGSQVHKEVENWIYKGYDPHSESAKWIIRQLEREIDKGDAVYYSSEVTVSDFDTTASNVDIVEYHEDGTVTLYDIKTGNFDREYCTLQLNAYRVMFEHSYPKWKVRNMKVINSKEEMVFPIIKRPDAQSLSLFEKNRKNKNNS